jgi:hypothetical protein
MALRILPFRQYVEEDVINLFALSSEFVNESTTESSSGDAGVFVAVGSSNLDLDPVTYGDNSYLGKTDYPHVGANQYPSVSLTCKPAHSGTGLLGITLRQTAKFDENGEKLLYYRQKAEELQCVLPGQAVPVATRGVFTIAATAFSGTMTPGSGFKLAASGNAGKVVPCAVNDADRVGMILGSGSRASGDQFAGNYAIVGLRY